MFKVGNNEKTAFIGNQRVSQAWVGDALIQPLWSDVIQENASLGEVLYFYDMGDSKHYTTATADGTLRIYSYNENGDDILLKTFVGYVMEVDGFFYTSENKLCRFDANDNLEVWTLSNLTTEIFYEMVKAGERYYARIQVNPTSTPYPFYAVTLDFQTKTLTRGEEVSSISTSNKPKDNVFWDRFVYGEDKSFRLYNNAISGFFGDRDYIRLSVSLPNSTKWSWVGTLNGKYYAIGAWNMYPAKPSLYRIDTERYDWTSTSIAEITDNISFGATCQKITLNGEEMLYITNMYKSSNYFTPNSYLLRIVDNQPIVKKYENNTYIALSQFGNHNFFVASNFTYSRNITGYNSTYLVKFDEDFNIVPIKQIDDFSGALTNSAVPTWKFKNEAFIGGRVFQLINN